MPPVTCFNLGEPAMKKSLIALAVLGASGFAMAQSSVTLYGVADVGVGKIKSGTNDANNKAQFTSGSLMNNGASRIGLRGVEDLGGGLKVGFQFETGIDMDDGATVASGGQFWGRRAQLSLGGNWGSVILGRQLTPSNLVTGTYELTGDAGYSALSNTYGYAGIESRASSAFAYATPNWGGFSGAVAFVSKNDDTNRSNKNAWDLGLMYNNGPIAAGVSANKVGDRKTGYQVGGKYSFGSFSLAASYNSASDDARRVRRGASLGVGANFGAFGLAVDVVRDTKNEQTGKKYTNGVVEGKYALSKRTFVYGAYLRLDGDNNYGFGIRHNF